ncbi:DUF305 domain-containing protein [Sphaerisporangium sp. TRM90804]|uniref:DUF305 domain-containing protein n=1 Tax=Sphaerisporangium sp. TRM90804 TaxID=3031113 RepID=UPI00244C085D|nr:DUF305 domain-containing protein [Sphaerisporangium sp. TRM90804]MDH2429003.1 DUF305 domain-containing protein [Sphaerisporangium sp. TRM90804]
MKRVAAALLAVLLLPACGAAAERPAEPVNAEDVMFLQMMIPHHRQGIEIVRLAAARAKDPEVRTLASAIEVTQDGEVRRMTAWLRSWDQPLAAPSDAHAHHGGMPRSDRRQIAALGTTDEFDRDFLNLLLAHQDDAVQMATVEAANGAHPQVRDWATQVERSREAQIEQMLRLLGEPRP